MVDRDTGIGRTDGGVDVDGVGERTATDRARRRGLRGRLRGRIGQWFSLRALLVQSAVVLVGVVVLGALFPFGTIGDLVGIFAATFGSGLVARHRRYLEVGVASAVVGGLWALLGNVVLAVIGAGIPLVTFGIGGGTLAGLLGYYFGRDLRDGLTRDL